jgi:hypothetical protein
MQYTITTEEESEAKRIMHVAAVASALWEFDQWLRAMDKHGEDSKLEASDVRNKLWECFSNEGIPLMNFIL